MENKYTKVDKAFSKKFWTALDRMCRYIPKDKSHHPYGDRCEKQIFVQRTLQKWFSGKYLAVILEKDTGFFKDDARIGDDTIKRKAKTFVFISNIRYALSHGEDIAVIYFDATNHVKISDIVLDEYKFNKLEFYEIDKEQYGNVVSMFADDRPKKSYKFKTWNKDDMNEGFKMRSKTGRDRGEARDLLQKENPSLFVY
jgi:hypothetical protein